MAEIAVSLEDQRSNSVLRYAQLANKTPSDLIVSWIDNRVTYCLILSLRAEGLTWEEIAPKAGVSITQARRIYSRGINDELQGTADKKDSNIRNKLLNE